MSEKKREYYIRRIENALKSDDMSICHEVFFTEDAIRDILELLKAEPTITELISCRDCKHFQMTDNDECRYCKIWFAEEEPGNYYCADAERKE